LVVLLLLKAEKDYLRTDSGSLTFSRQCIADEFLV
jgi:hypothetical protein